MGAIQRLTNGTTGGPVWVYVQDGKILRMTPMTLDDDDAASWSIEARGRSFRPPRKTTLAPHAVAQRSLVYSPARIFTPLSHPGHIRILQPCANSFIHSKLLPFVIAVHYLRLTFVGFHCCQRTQKTPAKFAKTCQNSPTEHENSYTMRYPQDRLGSM